MVVAFALLAAVPAISPQRFGIGYDGPVALAKNSAHGEVIVATNADVITVNEDGDAVSNSVAGAGGGGSAVAISDDGTFVAVRADDGALVVYKLDSEASAQLFRIPSKSGVSLSLSGNGSVLVVGTPTSVPPSANVYEWDGSGHVFRSAEHLMEAADSLFGVSVSVSADGSRFVVGADELSNSGAAFVYEYNASAHATVQLGDPLSVSGTLKLGYFVRMSSDGNALLATSRKDTYQSEWNGAAWSQPTPVFEYPDSDEDMSESFGNAVALSGDGTIAARADIMGINPGDGSFEVRRIKIRIKNLATGFEAVGQWDVPDCAPETEGNIVDGPNNFDDDDYDDGDDYDDYDECPDIGHGDIDLNSDGTVMVIAAFGEIRAYYRDDAGSWDLTDPTAPTTAAPTAAPTTAAGAESASESDGLSDASIAAIVAASVALAAVLGFVAYQGRWNVLGSPNQYGPLAPSVERASAEGIVRS